MLTTVKNINHDILNYEDHTYLLVGKWSTHIDKIIEDYNAIIITSGNSHDFDDIVRRVRTHSKATVFLKPLFFEDDIKAKNGIHTDGKFNKLKSAALSTEILLKNNSVAGFTYDNFESEVRHKTIQYLYTRSGMLKPQKNRFEALGYSFPFVDLFFDAGKLEKVQLLSQLVNDGLLEDEVINKLQLCKECHDSFLMFKETCPKCKSISIESEDVIHHFSCAHVAPVSQFKVDGSDHLECPKCHKQLRHIGIDYDRPSSVFSCLKCDNNFQEPNMYAECHSCDTMNVLESLIEVPINTYKLTMKGILHVEQKNVTLGYSKPSDDHVFNELVLKESERKFTSNKSSFKVALTFQGKLLNVLDHKFLQKLWKELLSITKEYVGSDLYQYHKDQTIMLLFTDTGKAVLEEKLAKLQRNLEILLEDNVGKGIDISYSLIDVKEGINP